MRVFVKGGFAEVDADRLTVLAERALDVAAFDAAGIAAELLTAEAELAAATGRGRQAGRRIRHRQPARAATGVAPGASSRASHAMSTCGSLSGPRRGSRESPGS